MPSLGRWKIPQTRVGRRSISVGKLLEKERLGTLFHKQGARRSHGAKQVVVDEVVGRLLERRGETKDGKLKHSFKLDGETTFQGLDIAVENDVGSTRSGRDSDGSRWSVKYKTPYGYIRGTTGADGEEVDCYVGRDGDAEKAYVVHQKTDDGSYDEDTVMLGYGSQAAAKSDILRHYSDPKYVGEIVPVAMERLKELFDTKKKLVKISFATKDPEYVDADAEGTTGLPVPRRGRLGDVPSRDDVELNPTPKVEARGSNMETQHVGAFHSPGGFDDLGKFGAALSELGAMSEDWEGDADVGLSLSTAREKELRGPGPFHTLSEITAVDPDVKMAMVRHAFLEELVKIGQAHGVPPWAGELEDFARYVEAFQKEAFSGGQALGGVRQFAQKAIGKLRPAVDPEVAAMRKGVGFFSTGMGKDLSAGGKALAHNPQAAGRAAGLGAKDLGSLNAMRPSNAGRRIAGETAMGAGHHMSHAGAGLMAMNPVGVPMGGAIEGFTRGVGKEMAGAAHKGVQAAGRGLVKHAPKVGFAGELLAGNALHAPGLASMAGKHLAPAAHGLAQHVLGAGVQEASMAAPKLLPRLAPRVGQAMGQAAAGLKARAGQWGGRMVGA